MCGRFVLTEARADLASLFGITTVGGDLPEPSYNIAPSQTITIVLDSIKDDVQERRLESARWGLVAPSRKSLREGPTPFNARAEKLATSGLYHSPFAHRRAIIPASGFYERRHSDDRQSFYIHPSNNELLAFAGLYEWWRDPNLADDDPARWLLSATIITHPAQATMTTIHDREPLYLAPHLWNDWLNPTISGSADLLATVADASTTISASLDYLPIGPAWLSTAASSRQDGPGLIEPI